MYQVSNTFHTKSYSGSSEYKAILKIGDDIVPTSQIISITMDNPIIDTSSDTFYVGSFIANTLKIKFKNLDGLNIESGVSVQLEIGQYIDNTDPAYQYTQEQHDNGYIDGYEYVPMGLFTIDELKENYQETCEIDCIDSSINFKQAVDYSECFSTHIIDDKEVNCATIDEILQYICGYCGVQLDSEFPTTNGDYLIGTYNNTISGKQWISYIAEIKGCNAKIGRDGVLYLIPLKQASEVSINALSGKEWKLGEKFSLKQICFYNGGRWLESSDPNPNAENILYIRTGNPFVQDNDQQFIDNIYDVLENLVIYNVQHTNRADVSLDAWDNLEYTLGEDSYITLNHSTYTYQGAISSKNNVVLPSKQEEQTTNVIKPSIAEIANKALVTVDTVNGTITQLTSRVTTIEGNYVSTESFEDFQDGMSRTWVSKQETTDGSLDNVYIKSTNFTFDQNGFSTSASESDTNINLGFYRENDIITKEGLLIQDKNGGKELLFAGYEQPDPNVDGSTIVRVDNMTTKNYQVAQYNDNDVWRREIINDETDGLGYAFFYVGDDE